MNEVKDSTAIKIMHYFVTKEDYKPVLVKGTQNEIWLENFDKSIKLIRINTNHLHNIEQYEMDIDRTSYIMKHIGKKTFTLSIKMLNILLDTGDNLKIEDKKNISTIIVNDVKDFIDSNAVKEYFPDAKEKLFNKKLTNVDLFSLTNDMNNKTIKEDIELDKVFSPNKPFITVSLIVINAIIFILMLIPQIYELFINLFANYYVNVGAGEVYRLLTSAFLHADIFHITCNMYALYIVGKEVESFYGHKKFLLIYLISAVVGSLFSCVLTTSPSIGASGAVFGIFGSLLYFTYNFRSTADTLLRSSIVPTIIINLVLGFVVPGIDVFAHIGGLIAGYLVSMAVGIETRKNKVNTINGIIILILLTIFMTYLLLIK